MKKYVCLLLAVCVCLSGCAALPPRQAADGLARSGDWVTVGGVIGVETPGGLDPLENNDALSANGMYYATWSMGEAVPYTNADGEASELYDAQLYLLLAGYPSSSSMSRWMPPSILRSSLMPGMRKGTSISKTGRAVSAAKEKCSAELFRAYKRSAGNRPAPTPPIYCKSPTADPLAAGRRSSTPRR